ncbi:hypothetical protein P691DRAFT_766292 [Macrolepiota fuliginosa MF-IS2]|uniref:Uncharacterized protein n=1 Tax=Macrolepiota fuliginosa MF-IS2 TaxID=1400762 RepID=A0A9P5WYW9_9AGAR|nr:hypothetical protein P691DRAFT_766292 [Macrolepiota fuliginosa MF-IS2]
MATSRYNLRNRLAAENNQAGESQKNQGNTQTIGVPLSYPIRASDESSNSSPPGLHLPVSVSQDAPVTSESIIPSENEGSRPNEPIGASEGSQPSTPRASQMSVGRDHPDADENSSQVEYITSASRQSKDCQNSLNSASDMSLSTSVHEEGDSFFNESTSGHVVTSTPVTNLESYAVSKPQLTAEEIANIEKANFIVNVEKNAHGEGSGKGIDPLNWGNLGIPREEMNMKAQQVAFDELAALKEREANNQ